MLRNTTKTASRLGLRSYLRLFQDQAIHSYRMPFLPQQGGLIMRMVSIMCAATGSLQFSERTIPMLAETCAT